MSHDAQQGPPPRDAYGAKWASHVESPTRQRIRSEVYGDEYPAEVDPRSFLTWTELRRLARELRVGRGDTFVDLGLRPGRAVPVGGARDRRGRGGDRPGRGRRSPAPASAHRSSASPTAPASRSATSSRPVCRTRASTRP